jgi:hypothetical protein
MKLSTNQNKNAAPAYYFLHFLVVLPLVGWFERPQTLSISISQSVLQAAGFQIYPNDKSNSAAALQAARKGQ